MTLPFQGNQISLSNLRLEANLGSGTDQIPFNHTFLGGSSTSLGSFSPGNGATPPNVAARPAGDLNLVEISKGWQLEQYIISTDSNNLDYFGDSVAISGDGNTLVVGALFDDSAALNAGSIYIYTRSGSTWTFRAKFSGTSGTEAFGASVAISRDGSTIAVGATSGDPSGVNNAGVVYIFVGSGASWNLQAVLAAPDPVSNDSFGYSVNLSSDGNRIIIGSYADRTPPSSNPHGSAYIFVRSGTSWSFEQKLLPSSLTSQLYFGESVAIDDSGSTVLIGAPDQSVSGFSLAGSIYVFVRSGSSWTQEFYLNNPNPRASAQFGTSVSLSSDGNTLAALSFDYVYVYNRSSGFWLFSQRLDPVSYTSIEPDLTSVSISGDKSKILIGSTNSSYKHSFLTGMVMVFVYDGNRYYQEAILSQNITRGGSFGDATGVSTNGNTVVAGAPFSDTDGVDSSGICCTFIRSRPQVKLSDFYGATFHSALFAFGQTSTGENNYVNIQNMVNMNGTVGSDLSSVGTSRTNLAAARYGQGAAIFAYGRQPFAHSNIITRASNLGIIVEDGAGVGTQRSQLAAVSYNNDKALFAYGAFGFGSVTNVSNQVSNTGVVSSDNSGVGTSRYGLAGASWFGNESGIFGFGAIVDPSFQVLSMINSVSYLGVISTDTSTVGSARVGLAACTYSTRLMFVYGVNAFSQILNVSNIINGSGVIQSDTSTAGTARTQAAGSSLGINNGIIGYGSTSGPTFLNITNQVSNTGVISSDISGVGTSRSGLAASGVG